jgi:hypothetical protein
MGIIPKQAMRMCIPFVTTMKKFYMLVSLLYVEESHHYHPYLADLRALKICFMYAIVKHHKDRLNIRWLLSCHSAAKPPIPLQGSSFEQTMSSSCSQKDCRTGTPIGWINPALKLYTGEIIQLVNSPNTLVYSGGARSTKPHS